MPATTSTIPVGLQIWTLREECERDFFGTLKSVAEVGYRWIEPFTFFGAKPAVLAHVLRDLGLGVVSSHVDLNQLENELERVMDDHDTLGCKAIVCPWLDEDRREGDRAFEKIGETLEGIGERLGARGFTLAYHNHDFEFAVRNPDGLQRILAQAKPENLTSQLDTYWIDHAGLDPIEYIYRLGPRLSSIHLKDRDPADGQFSPIWHGSLDMRAILEAGRDLGVMALIVEQDLFKRPPIESIKMSLDFLRAEGFGG